ncbi:tetratricopeptide repeat protein [Rugamonas sp. DEMB1]|uniref:tetratricopeptide repeat protein n=1 Tax=Rugamonas sp. DEMB1 TaxID=3039386 RepID=UPI00244D28ED|nr:tetratricopeptide repeat protein [Rugamonas sp. DEMB1]WGG50269.1 tetratricopeptide repeat protein [Rugamonas sp. DEMB1]
MRTTIRLIGLACASSMLFACSGMGGAPAFQQAAPPQPAPPGPEPSAAGPDADGYYALGRAQHGALRYEAALAAYRRALQLDPAHVNARNGLAVLHAGRGDYAEAIALWRALLPAAGAGAGAGTGAGPQAAFLWGNLGYAYFLSGADEPALAALERACLLDPLNALSWEHLGELLQRMGQGERAALMRRQAASLRQHDYRRDYALLAAAGGGAAGAPAAPPPSATATATAAATATSAAGPGPGPGTAEPPAWPPVLAQTEVRREGAALVSVHRVAAGAAVSSSAPVAAAVVPVPPPTAAPSDRRVGFRLAALTGEDIDPAATLASVALSPRSWATSAPARLEISNGNGVAGMAAALARTVAGDALQVVRLSNVRHFAVPSSRIEYQQPQEAAARALAARLGLRVAAQGEARGSAELRIVLGRDLLDPALLRQRYLK